MPKSLDARLEELERKVERASSEKQLSVFDAIILDSQIELILFVTPVTELPKLQPFLTKIRKIWGIPALEKHIKKMNWTEDGIKGKFVNQLSQDQLYYLLEGKESGNKSGLK